MTNRELLDELDQAATGWRDFFSKQRAQAKEELNVSDALDAAMQAQICDIVRLIVKTAKEPKAAEMF